MKNTAHIVFLAVLLLVSGQFISNAQSKKELKKENTELRSYVDSLKRVQDSLLAKICQYEQDLSILAMTDKSDRRTPAGFYPEEYNPDITDSLLCEMYRQKIGDTVSLGNGFNIDSSVLASILPDSVITERLENLNSFITLPFNPTVRNYIVLYSEKMPERMAKMLGLCDYYMPIFEETFNRYNLPEELKYMSIIESALNPFAVSRAGARGLWQFMYRTAVSYGLRIDSYIDERQDPIKATDAAARYFKDLYALFGDWNLAISAYNCGPGNVNKAIRRAGGKRDFWSVYDYLPRETRGYVPAFVGAMYAIKYRNEYGLKADSFPLPPQVDTFEIHQNLHLQQVSDVIGVPIEVVKTLNPKYIKDIIPGQGGTLDLKLPFNYTNIFLEKEDSVYAHKAEELLNPKTLVDKAGGSESYQGGSRTVYKVAKGDYLGKIARKYHVSVAQLRKWNHLRSDNLQVGQKIYIYRNRK